MIFIPFAIYLTSEKDVHPDSLIKAFATHILILKYASKGFGEYPPGKLQMHFNE